MGYTPFELENGQQPLTSTYNYARILWEQPIILGVHEGMEGHSGDGSYSVDECGGTDEALGGS
jgi:hypothetical protein